MLEEIHPLRPFLPPHAKLLMLGSFPPPRERWSMEFYYPNFQNDMWRIFGLVFFGNANQFVIQAERKFRLQDIVDFVRQKRIAFFDTATRIRRLDNNASDKNLEIVCPTDLLSLMNLIPECIAVVTTGQKATEVMCSQFKVEMPPVGHAVQASFGDRVWRCYRMPSSSRAYPLALSKKAEIYRKMFEELGFISGL